MSDSLKRMGLHNGKTTDLLIEDLLQCIYDEKYDAEGFDAAYTKIVQEHINEECPNLCAAHAGRDRVNVGAVHYLAMLRLDYLVVNAHSKLWPDGGFPNMEDALVAVAVYHDDGETLCALTPGRNINQASLAAPIQYARELSAEYHASLPLTVINGGGDAY